MRKVTGISNAIVAAVILAALSTAADFVWARWIPAHRPMFGLIHGALLFMCMGAVLGFLAARSRPGVAVGVLAVKAAGGMAAAGLLAAASFYAMFSTLGWSSMFVAWMGIWVLTALLNRYIRQSREGWRMTTGRGIAAALSSGLAFYAISGIWLTASTRSPNYAVNLVSWAIAFLPGFACLLVESRARFDAAPDR